MRIVQATGFTRPPHISCPTCQFYTWNMRTMQPVYVGTEPHHPGCQRLPRQRAPLALPPASPRAPAGALGAFVGAARVGTWEDDQKTAYTTGYSQGLVDARLGNPERKDPAGEKGAGVVTDEGTKLAFNSGYAEGYKKGLEAAAPATPPAPPVSGIEKINAWGPYADQREAAIAAMAAVRGTVPGANDNLVDILAAIGLFESDYGLTYSWRMPDGRPSYNWGALHRGSAPCTQEMVFVHNDKNAAGVSSAVQFAAFPNMTAGLSCFLKIWANALIMDAALEGNATNVAAAMYARRYFAGCGRKCDEICCGTNEERILEYARLIQGVATRVAGFAGRGTKVYVGPVPKNWRNLTVALNPSAPYPGDVIDKPLSSTATGGIGLLTGVAIGAGALFFLVKKGKITV